VPTFVCCTENGSITSTMIAAMLKQIDYIGLFELNEFLPDQFLLLDGHGSRFELPFLEYMDDTWRRWCTCVSAPYGTKL
jgi:hypothetical protein